MSSLNFNAVETNFSPNLHLSKLIMTVLTFRDVSKFSRVNAAIIADYEHAIIFKFAKLHIRLG